MKAVKNSNKPLSSIFPKYVFWDCDVDKLSLKNWQDRSFIIQRVLKMADVDFKVLVNKLELIFSIEEIKYYANESMEIIGNELIEKLCNRYKMKPSQFPYYKSNLKQSMYA
ncbi:MAG: hypothetical protein K0B10_08615 [Vicingaceae bacterium]|nr:hypothetical protein [Vicingaceae bacterium]MDT8411003.1 hypothetical protein [Vicingaceae bacterium]